MSGSIAPDPPDRAARRGSYLRSCLVISIGLIWTHGGARGLPGPPRGESVKCPYCRKRGEYIAGGSYVCKNKHVFTAAEAKRREGKNRK